MTGTHKRGLTRRPPQDLMRAVHDSVVDFGVDELARLLVCSPGTIYNKINANDTSHHIPTLADAVIWPRTMGDYRIPQAYCRALDGAFVSLHLKQHVSDVELLNIIMKRDVEQGEFAVALERALDDGAISSTDYTKLHRAGWDVITAWLEILARLEGMVND